MQTASVYALLIVPIRALTNENGERDGVRTSERYGGGGRKNDRGRDNVFALPRTALLVLPTNEHGARERARVALTKSHIVYIGARHLRKIIGCTRRYGVEAARRYPVYNRPIRSGYYLGNIQRRGRRLERAHALAIVSYAYLRA